MTSQSVGFVGSGSTVNQDWWKPEQAVQAWLWSPGNVAPLLASTVYSAPISSRYFASPVAADLDGDGWNEVIVGNLIGKRAGNDRFVALDLLRNANIAAGGVLPSCQDTGTAIIKGKKGQFVVVNGGEDVDLCFRAREHGHVNAVALASTVLHHISSSAGRKLRDEENSRRLLARWRRAFALAADEACRDWCRAHFERILIDPRTADPVLARHAWFYALGLTRTPPLEAIAFIEAGQNREFARWDSTFTH